MSLEQTRQRRRTVEAIHDIVGAMRAIAAGRIQTAQRALANARRYQDVIERALAHLQIETASLAGPRKDNDRTLLLVLTSEQPFCGSFNQEVLKLAEERWRELRRIGQVHLITVGQRGDLQMKARGMLADDTVAATTSLPGLRNLVRHLSQLVDRHYASGDVSELRVIYNRYRSVSQQIPTEEKLLPFENGLSDQSRPQSEQAASDTHTETNDELFHYMSLAELAAGLISEYVFISLYRIAAESFASEQASRLVAMDGATRNTEKMLESLAELEHRQRQEQITRQVLELIAARLAEA
jgi:F-type H+-transporting ATPase subunit gamma